MIGKAGTQSGATTGGGSTLVQEALQAISAHPDIHDELPQRSQDGGHNQISSLRTVHKLVTHLPGRDLPNRDRAPIKKHVRANKSIQSNTQLGAY